MLARLLMRYSDQLAILNFQNSEPSQFLNMKSSNWLIESGQKLQCPMFLNFHKNDNIDFRNFCLVVVWNLVTIAVERYLAVCQPFKHSGFTKRKVVGVFIGMYTIGIPVVFLAAFDVIIF